METPALVFGGIIVSLIVELIKRKAKTSTFGTMVSVAILSLLGAGVYVALVHFGYWEAFLKIIVIAGAFYAYIVKNTSDLMKP